MGGGTTSDRLERLARIHRTWRRAYSGRRWYHHWTPIQAAFLQGIAPLVLVLPIDGALVGAPWNLMPTEWLGGVSLAGLLLAWGVVVAGNALLGMRLLRWKAALPPDPAKRITAIVLVSVPLLGLRFLARRPVGCESAPSLPRIATGSRLRLVPHEGPLAEVRDHLAGIADEPLVVVAWLWVGNFGLLLASCQWVADHCGPPLLWGLYLLFHGVAVAAFVPERAGSPGGGSSGHGSWALLAFLPAPVAFLPFLGSASSRGASERWTLCGEAHTSLGSMSRLAAWQRVRRFLGRRRSWERIPWRLRLAPGLRAGVEGRRDGVVGSLARWKLAALVLEAGMLGWFSGSRKDFDVDGLAVGMSILAALAILSWCRVPLRRFAELVRLRVPRAVRPGPGFAATSTSLAALALLVGREMAALSDPREALKLFVLAGVVVLVLAGTGAVALVPMLRGLEARFDVVPLLLWGATFLGLLSTAAWSAAQEDRAHLFLGGLGLLAATAPIWEVGTGWWWRCWLLRPFGTAAAPWFRLGRVTAWLAILPMGALLLPAWWGLAARADRLEDGDGR